MIPVVKKHHQRSEDNASIPRKTQKIRHLAEQDQPKQCGKHDLRIVVDGDFSCRCVRIGSGDRELTACSKQTG